MPVAALGSVPITASIIKLAAAAHSFALRGYEGEAMQPHQPS